MVYENTQIFNNVCDLCEIARTFSWLGVFEEEVPSNNDVVAFRGIDREIPIYRPIPGIVEGSLQKVALLAW